MGKWDTAGQQALALGSAGAALGPIGFAGGAALGGIAGLIAGSQEEKAQEELKRQIESMPDFRDSEAFLNASAQAARADRWAQEGMSAQQLNQANQGVSRVAGQTLANAGSLESGLLGQSGTAQSLTDAYTSIAMQDAQTKQANRQQALQAQKNLQDAQEDAFSLDLGKSQNLLDLSMGQMASDRQDRLNTQQNITAGLQNVLNADGAMGKWGSAVNSIGGMFNKNQSTTAPTLPSQGFVNDPITIDGNVVGNQVGFTPSQSAWNFGNSNPLFGG